MDLKEHYLQQTQVECVFCNPSKELILAESENFTLMLDPFALIPGHLLLTSRAHYGCLGEVPEPLQEECSKLRLYGYDLLAKAFDKGVTRYEHGRAGHCISRGKSARSCHHYHEHLIPEDLSIHPLLESSFKSILYSEETEVIDLFDRYHEYLLVCESDGSKRFYVAKSENVPPHLLRTLTAKALGKPELHDWEGYTSCELMLEGKQILSEGFVHA
jgi:diadenosine tetraphosphate (Ap4A) HIT family hydrolase